MNSVFCSSARSATPTHGRRHRTACDVTYHMFWNTEQIASGKKCSLLWESSECWAKRMMVFWLVGWLVGWLGFLLLVFPHSWDRVVPFRQYCGPWNERNSFKLASRLDLHSYSTGLIYVTRFSDASEYRQTPISVRDCRAKRCLWETCDAYVCYFRK